MKNYEEMALIRAEKIGVYEYKVTDNLMIYYSFFGSEGFYKVTHNLDNGKETRKHIKAKKPKAEWYEKGHYNYFCG